MSRKACEGLTQREQEVMKLMARGFSDKQTANELGTCYYTVRQQVQTAVKKLGARNRPHAVALMLAATISQFLG